MQQFQKLRGFAVLTGIVTTLALASSTLAEPPAPGGGGGGGPGQGGPGRGGRPEFKDVDKNGDGFITEDEVPAERWERLKKADTDGDGKISEEEYKKARPGGGRGPRQPGGGGGGGGGEPKPGNPSSPK